MNRKRHVLSSHDTCRVAVVALCTTRTVDKHMAGGRTLPAIATAINRALTDLGFGHLVPSTPKTPEVLPAA